MLILIIEYLTVPSSFNNPYELIGNFMMIFGILLGGYGSISISYYGLLQLGPEEKKLTDYSRADYGTMVVVCIWMFGSSLIIFLEENFGIVIFNLVLWLEFVLLASGVLYIIYFLINRANKPFKKAKWLKK